MRTAWVVIASSLGGCASNGATVLGAADDASAAEDAEGDAATVPPSEDAGPLWMSCAPTAQGTCPAGLTCLSMHTAPVDAYGTCVFSCAGSNGPACAVSGGTCSCPAPTSGAAGDCSLGNDAGEVTVCVPAGDAAVFGTNQLGDAGPQEDDAGDSGPHDAGVG